MSEKGENSIFIYPGSNELITKEYADSVLENFDSGDIIILQNEISNVDYIAKAAYRKGMCVILNPSPINKRIQKIDFGKITYLILNEVEIQTITECEDTEKALKLLKEKYPNLKIMLTLGLLTLLRFLWRTIRHRLCRYNRNRYTLYNLLFFYIRGIKKSRYISKYIYSL